MNEYNPADQQAGIAYAERVAIERFASTGEQVSQTTRMLMGCAFEAGAAHGRAVPAGWKLVPVEPTKEMIVAGKEAHWEADNAAASGNDGFAQFGMRVKRAAHVYRAMLAATPAAPVAQEPATWVSVADRLPSEDSEVIVSGWAYNDPARGRFVTHADFSDGQFKPVGAADEYDALHPPTHWMPMPAAPGEAAAPAAEQPACPGCNGHGLVGGFVNAESGYDAEECQFCCGDGFIHGTECGACAEQPDAWTPSGSDYDRNIHRNPDAAAWADLFVATFPGLADKRDLMLGWFANAMMAMHDFLKAKQPDTVKVPRDVLRAYRESLADGLETVGSAEAEWSAKDRALVASIDALLAGGAE